MSSSSSFNLRIILDKEKLNRTNFMDRFRSLRIVLKQEKKEYVIEQLYPEEPEGVWHNTAQYRQYVKHIDVVVDIQCLKLAFMSLCWYIWAW